MRAFGMFQTFSGSVTLRHNTPLALVARMRMRVTLSLTGAKRLEM